MIQVKVLGEMLGISMRLITHESIEPKQKSALDIDINDKILSDGLMLDEQEPCSCESRYLLSEGVRGYEQCHLAKPLLNVWMNNSSRYFYVKRQYRGLHI